MSINSTMQSFQADVIDASADALVLVDFWAEWCGPCKSLGPILEKLEADYGGRVKLVKIDTEAEQQIAQHFQIQSLPTVYLFLNGQPVDQFQGALPEGQIREFIDRHLPDPAAAEFELAAKALNEGDQAGALDHAKRTISLDPKHDTARLLIAQLQLAAGDPGAAQSQMDAISNDSLANPEVAELAEQIAQAFEATQVPPPTELLQKVELAPNDPQAKADLAEHYITHKMWEEALEQLLEIVKIDREFQDDFGRQKMIEVFKLAAEQPTVVSAWRRKLGATLNVV